MAKTAKAAAQVLQGNETEDVATTGPTSVAFAMPAGLKVARMITVPSLVLKKVGQSATLRIDSPMRVSKVVDAKQPKREPATICDVVEVTTGEQFIWLVPSVVKSNLERDYPESSFVGKKFYVQNLGKRAESQRYSDFGIAEVE